MENLLFPGAMNVLDMSSLWRVSCQSSEEWAAPKGELCPAFC